MRRKDREVIGDENIAKIIEQCTTCHVAMVDDAGAPHKFEFTPEQAATVTVFKITSSNFTGKAKPEKQVS